MAQKNPNASTPPVDASIPPRDIFLGDPNFSIVPFITTSEDPSFIPSGVKVGDIILARHAESQWRDEHRPSMHYNHAAIVVALDPLTIVEAAGDGVADVGQMVNPAKGIVIDDKKYQPAGPAEVLFAKSPMWGASNQLLKTAWLSPKFPNPIREISKLKKSERKVITETEARKRAIKFAREQIGEPYKLTFATNNKSETPSKWMDKKWYCSLLVYKAYSRSVTGMYLEDYANESEDGGGWIVYPDDILASRRTTPLHFWWRESSVNENRSQ